MWIRQDMIEAVRAKARVFYIDSVMTQRWNEHRRPDEPRLMTGWCWESKSPGGGHRTGIKTPTAAMIDAWYALVQHAEPPRIGRSAGRLRVVADTSKPQAVAS